MLLPLVLSLFAWQDTPPAKLPAQQPEPATKVQPAWQSFEFFREAYVIVEGRLNDRPVDILVDSGAGATVVSRRVAIELDLGHDGEVTASGVGGQVAAHFARNVTMEIGSTRVEGLRVVVLDLEEIGRRFGRKMEVILGRDVFGALVVDLDYPRRRVALRHPKDFTYSGSGVTLPITRTRDHYWQVPLKIEGLPPALFDIDTGDGDTLAIHAGFWKQHGLLEDRSQSVGLIGGVGGLIEVKVARLRSIEFAGQKLEDIPVTFDASEVGLFHSTRAAGNLGARILARYRVIFDGPRGQVHCEPDSEAASEPFRRDRAGLRAMWKQDHLEVLQVAPGSPAEAGGWQVGERIVAIDGSPIGADYWENLWLWSTRPADTKIRMKLADGEERTLLLRNYY